MDAPRYAVFTAEDYRLNSFHYCRIDNTPHSEKPEGGEVGAISNRIMAAPFEPYDLSYIAYVLAKGGSICPADFRDGKRSPEFWCGQQLWLVDVDNDEEAIARCGCGLREATAVERARAHGLPLVAAFQTFGGTECANIEYTEGSEAVARERYRLVFSHPQGLVTDRDEAQRFGKMLLLAYPEADQSTVQLNRMFFGTNKEVDICLKIGL